MFTFFNLLLIVPYRLGILWPIAQRDFRDVLFELANGMIGISAIEQLPLGVALLVLTILEGTRSKVMMLNGDRLQALSVALLDFKTLKDLSDYLIEYRSKRVGKCQSPIAVLKIVRFPKV